MLIIERLLTFAKQSSSVQVSDRPVIPVRPVRSDKSDPALGVYLKLSGSTGVLGGGVGPAPIGVGALKKCHTNLWTTSIRTAFDTSKGILSKKSSIPNGLLRLMPRLPIIVFPRVFLAFLRLLERSLFFRVFWEPVLLEASEYGSCPVCRAVSIGEILPSPTFTEELHESLAC